MFKTAHGVLPLQKMQPSLIQLKYGSQIHLERRSCVRYFRLTDGRRPAELPTLCLRRSGLHRFIVIGLLLVTQIQRKNWRTKIRFRKYFSKSTGILLPNVNSRCPPHPKPAVQQLCQPWGTPPERGVLVLTFDLSKGQGSLS